ncbi:MAG: D-aminoacyl-tRNA deacylase [bacterium]
MIALIQRVKEARVIVCGRINSEISYGLVVLLGVKNEDDENEARFLAKKVVNMRIFNNIEGKMNLSLIDIKGECLVVSQFTLHADERKGRRPSFIKAGKPELAEHLYNIFIEEVASNGIKVAGGVFGAMMEVHLINDGPVTIIAKSKNEYER